jgi:tRNA threonylcarbamoyladenosine biosynthesis protein TsaB
MLIFTIRTDKPEAEIGLYEDQKQLAYTIWTAHRELAETIEIKIDELLKSINKNRQDLQGIVAYQGPGSFTGLRIGLSVTNALAFTYTIPIVTNRETEWIERGIEQLQNNQNDEVILPFYGSEPNITAQKK